MRFDIDCLVDIADELLVKDILDLESEGIRLVRHKIDELEQKIVFEAHTTRLQEYCNCGGQLRLNGKRVVCFRDWPLGLYRVVIKLKLQRYRCLACKTNFQEEVEGFDGKRFVTKRCAQYIREQALRRTYKDVARSVGCSDKTITSVLKDYTDELDQEQVTLPDWIAIDEVHLRKSDKKPLCVISAHDSRKVIDILPNRLMPTVGAWLHEHRECANLQGVTMDMYRPYYLAFKKVFPAAKIVADKFHVVKLVRSCLMHMVDDLEGSAANGHRMLLKRRSRRLNPIEKVLRNAWLKDHPHLRRAYWVKESFFKFYNSSNRRNAEARLDAWRESISGDLGVYFKEILTETQNWREEILAYFDCKRNLRKTNALAEGLNNEIKVMNRMGRGHRSFASFPAKIRCPRPAEIGIARRRDLLAMLSQLSPIEQLRVAETGYRCQCCGGAYGISDLAIHHADDALAQFGIEGRRLLCTTCHGRVVAAEATYISSCATNNSDEPEIIRLLFASSRCSKKSAIAGTGVAKRCC